MNDLTALHLNNAVFLCGLSVAVGHRRPASLQEHVGALLSRSQRYRVSFLNCGLRPLNGSSAGSKHDVNETEFVQRSALTLPSEGFC